MSKTIDERVVEMKFDNKQFESNVQTSMSTIEKLKKSLNMDSAAKSFESLDKAANNVNMAGLGSAVESVKLKFSALDVMALRVLKRITDSAIDTGKQLVTSLSIDNIAAGWNKYEQKTASVQTIMNATGKSIDEVNEYLNRLMWFSDETSYSFTDMTAALAQMTSSGGDIDKLMPMITGIANATAFAGKGATEFSSTIRNLAQSYQAGYLQYQDMKSLNLMGTSSKQLKETFISVAESMGKIRKGRVTVENFDTTLKDKWADAEVMEAALGKFSELSEAAYKAVESGQYDTAAEAIEALSKDYDELAVRAFKSAQEAKTFGEALEATKDAVSSGWLETFEIIFGNYEEAKVLWTDLANNLWDAFASGAEARNAMLEEWKDLGGRTVLIEAFWTAWENVGKVLGTVKEAFREVFPSITAEQLYSVTESLKAFVDRLKPSDKALANLKSTFKGLFAILDIVKQAFSAIFTAIKPLFGGFGTLGDGILGVTGRIGDAIVKFDEFIKTSGAFQKVGEGIAFVIQTIMTAFTTLKNKIKEKIDSANFELFHSLLERIHERMSQVGETAGSMKSGVVAAFEVMGEALANCQFVKIFTGIWNVVKTVCGGIIKILGELGGSLASKLGDVNFSGIIDILNGISLGAIALGIKKFVESFKGALDGIGGLKDGILGILNGVKGCLEAYQEQLKAGTLLKIATAIGILAVSIIAISFIDSEKLSASLGAITVLFADLMGSMAIFDKLGGKKSSIAKSVLAMLGIATAVLILASALKKIGSLDFKQLAVGLTGVVGLTAMMIAAAKIMGRGGKTIINGATQMVIFAVAIKILASACIDLAALDWEGLAKGLVGVGALLGEVSLFMRTAKFSGKSITTATGIVILSAALKILASVCKDFGGMKWEEIGKGLAAIGGLLAEITIFTNLTGKAKHVISTGIALVVIGAAMKIFASAVADFGSMKWDEIGRGLTAMAGALAAVTISVKLMPKNMIGIGVGLITVSAALLIIAKALEQMGGMTWDSIAKGMVALGGSMTILAIGLNVMRGTLGGSAALLIAASALLILTPVLAALGAMSWESIAKGLVTLAGTFAVLGVAGLLLTPLVPTILALSGSLVLIGVAVVGIGAGLALAGVGLSALAIGLGALATAGTAGATAIVASLTVIIMGIAGLIPAIAAKIGEAIVEFCKVITNSTAAIGEAIKAVIFTLLDVLVECIPVIADGALKLVAGVLEALVEYTPSIVDSIFRFLIGVLEGIARNLPDLIKAAIDVLMAFFTGVVDALKGIDTETLLEGIVGIGLIAAIMAALAAVALLAPAAMIGVLAMGVVIAELALVLAAIGALAQIPGLEWLINEGGDLMQSIGTAIGKFIGGIVGGLMSGVSDQFPQIATDLSGFMTNIQPFIQGAAAIDPAMMDGVKALAETILILTAANILDGLTSWLTGGSSLTGFAEELVPFGTAMKQFADEIAGIDAETISNAAVAGKTLAEMASTLPNSGGVLGFFAGENDMDKFGEQLVPFGLAMKAFSLAVAGLDASVVEEASKAGMAMAEMASTIPNSGGVVGFFAGENDMDKFGEQLVPFGLAMKEFSLSVAGLKADVIQNSVTAGKALIELADTVPNTGGVVEWFTGNNDLDTFGEQLVPFGLAMKKYSLSVTGINANVVTNSATAAKALVELSDNLPNTGGIVSWFTGDNDIASFGEQLVTFGNSFTEYYNSISGVDVSKLSGAVDEFSRLVDLAKDVNEIDTSGLSMFGYNLTGLGNAGIDGFINAFADSKSRITDAIDAMVANAVDAADAQKENLAIAFASMVDSSIASLENQNSQFTTVGETMIGNFVYGVRNGDSTVRSTFTSIVTSCLTAIRNRLYEFNTAGQSVMTKFIAGVKSKTQLAKDAFMSMINDCVTAIRSKQRSFYNAGVNLVQGFVDGIESQIEYAVETVKEMAQAVVEAAQTELDINSPSKVAYQIGDYFGLGFVNALADYNDKSYNAGASIADSAKDGLRETISKISDYIDKGIDTRLTIRPVLDISEARDNIAKLSALLSRKHAMKISAGLERIGTNSVQNGDTSPVTGNSYSFVQNNYSPKALSRIDIYRQTKNQFAAMKGLVER